MTPKTTTAEPERSPTNAETSAPETETTTPDPPTSGFSRWLPWTVAGLAIAVAAFSTVQWLSLRSHEQARADVATISSDFVTALTNWDATDGIAEERAAIESFGTGTFLQEAEELFGGDLGDQLETLEATSKGTVDDVFVQRLEGDRAVTFAVVEQELRTDLSPDAPATFHSARIELNRVDGEWRISSVQLLSPVLDPAVDAGTPAPAPSEDAPSEQEQE